MQSSDTWDELDKMIQFEVINVSDPNISPELPPGLYFHQEGNHQYIRFSSEEDDTDFIQCFSFAHKMQEGESEFIPQVLEEDLKTAQTEQNRVHLSDTEFVIKKEQKTEDLSPDTKIDFPAWQIPLQKKAKKEALTKILPQIERKLLKLGQNDENVKWILPKIQKKIAQVNQERETLSRIPSKREKRNRRRQLVTSKKVTRLGDEELDHVNIILVSTKAAVIKKEIQELKQQQFQGLEISLSGDSSSQSGSDVEQSYSVIKSPKLHSISDNKKKQRTLHCSRAQEAKKNISDLSFSYIEAKQNTTLLNQGEEEGEKGQITDLKDVNLQLQNYAISSFVREKEKEKDDKFLSLLKEEKEHEKLMGERAIRQLTSLFFIAPLDYFDSYNPLRH